MGQALFRLYEKPGVPMFSDPRAVLERAMQPLQKMGLTMVMATELEFYLLDAKTDRPTVAGRMCPASADCSQARRFTTRTTFGKSSTFLNDVYDYCDAQDIPADSAIAEYSQGQFEINLQHIDDPVLACDHAVLLKRAVKAAARKHGFVACFMAKPFEDDAGSGLHIHMSLVDRNGRTIFPRQGQPRDSALFGQAASRGRRSPEDHAGGDGHLCAQRQFLSSPATRHVCAGRAATGASTTVSSRFEFRSRMPTICVSNIAPRAPMRTRISSRQRSLRACITD